MLYLLDTNVVVALLKQRQRVWERLRAHRRRDFGVSAIVSHELFFGAYHGDRQDETLAGIDALRFPVIDFTVANARQAGEIRAALAAAGTPIGPYDVLIAGQALARDVTLVTRNVREFSRVPGLRVEDWEGGGA